MSHSHSHAPGDHSHSHSHAPPQQQQQQQMVMPTPDPTLQAIIDASFQPVDLTVLPDLPAVVCTVHKTEKCDVCKQEYVGLNRLSKILHQNPSLTAPPPANVISKNLSVAVGNTKEEGNQFYKKGQHAQAIARYTMAASIAVQRPPWESNQFMREELSTIISNRSAAYCESQDYISALADADTVIIIRRNWSKGHFRKAKALVGLGKPTEARDALQVGLAFEPNNAELTAFLADVEKLIEKQNQKASNDEKAPIPA
ncbi:tetratricopeptide repeat domain containing protein [Moniliophthora roreri MCA 2997]|uniref:Tetratricopeptide repeat domain containing protein n=2 Tax=Moniliophthora roreri TaxID=221103 RepID=V2XAG1_MONRO|nr:tetratricopeptide repeat domain containing protein [Moniliophthora roreri MCA 2997]KAI3619478.1 tetratricopeptide repeat domain containing protein [Moniliophthora roreri]